MGTQGDEVVAGIGLSGGQGNRLTVTGDNQFGRKLFDLGKSGKPLFRVAHGQYTEHALCIHHITRKHDLHGGQPDQHVAGRMCAPAMTELKHHTAQRKALIRLGQPALRQSWHSAIDQWPQRGAQHVDVIVAPVLHVRTGLRMGNHFSTLRLKIGIPQPSVVLPTCVNDPSHRLRRDFFDSSVDLPRTDPGGATVDQDSSLGCYHQAYVGIEPLVCRCAWTQFTCVYVHALCYGLKLYVDGTRHRHPKRRQRK